MSKARGRYHHGALRNTLIAVATELLSEGGTHALSLRKMAQKAGVSHNAPYMHLADKEAVLAAIAEVGFRLLSEQVKVAVVESENTRNQLIAASRAYVKFALANPNHLQVMFRHYEVLKYPALIESSQKSLNQLFEIIIRGQAEGVFINKNPHEITKAIWSLIHGVAAISIAYKETIILPEKKSTEEVVETFVNLFIDGLATK